LKPLDIVSNQRQCSMDTQAAMKLQHFMTVETTSRKIRWSTEWRSARTLCYT
jgi:hypothetical protein